MPLEDTAPTEHIHVVGLGASAGGLAALKEFFSEVPADSGLAYVVVSHLSPDQPSMMPELLDAVASIPVVKAQDDVSLEADHCYVLPPDRALTIQANKLQLRDLESTASTLGIDHFLRSLAREKGGRSAAVILSGTGTDGTQGIREIKASGGLVLVQSEESAMYNGMPRSALDTGVADLALTPSAMPLVLMGYFPRGADDETPIEAPLDSHWMNQIFNILRSRLGHDFSAYKSNTIRRRITRRMGLSQIATPEEYVRRLHESPPEVESLFRDLLIGVTSFFRDQDSFEALKEKALPRLMKQVGEGTTFRVWVPGCSTGEEVYSLAMVLRQALDRLPGRVELQLFGTDIDDRAVERAREGLYPASIAADVGKLKLKRFFTEEGQHYRIGREIRDSVVFSVQDMLRDPPFSRLNLLCCRNVLIYFGGEAQKRLLPLFHYTLRPGGVLMLGSSETIGGFTDLFEVLDQKWKIFGRQEAPPTMLQNVKFPHGPATAIPIRNIAPTATAPKNVDIGQVTRQAVLRHYSPSAVLIDAGGEVLHVQGRVGKYLEPPSGPPTNNVLNLAREGLGIELSSALRAIRSGKTNICRTNVTVKTEGESYTIDLSVHVLEEPAEMADRILVVFEDVPTTEVDGREDLERAPDVARLSLLERELQLTRESHQSTVEELESSNEELKSTNEELQSSNEELQSTNEELESSKEELQSLNEELQTVNAELQSKVEELSLARDDMRNLLNSTEIATIFVDNNMLVRRFTPQATEIVNLIESDIGRPLEHVVNNLDYDEMIQDLNEVLERLLIKEVEVQTNNDEWYSMRILPYRTTDNRIDGAVLTFTCIGEQKKGQETMHDLMHSVLDFYREPALLLDEQGVIGMASEAFVQARGGEPG